MKCQGYKLFRKKQVSFHIVRLFFKWTARRKTRGEGKGKREGERDRQIDRQKLKARKRE